MKTPEWLFPSDPAVQSELFVLGYRNLASNRAARIVLPLLVAWGVWETAPTERLGLWLGSMVLLSFACQVLLRLFRNAVTLVNPGGTVLRRWQILHASLMVAIGLGWACLGLLFVPNAHVQNMILVLVFCGILAASALSTGPSDYIACTLGSLLAVVVFMLQLRVAFDQQTPVLVVTFCLYFLVLATSTRNVRLTLLQAINLRLANTELAQRNSANALRAEKANRDKSEFLAAASHDLRQPVHALLLLVEAYRQQTPGAASHPLLAQISTAGQSISGLFNALMELSRLESGTEKLAPSTFKLNDAMMRVLSRIHPEAEQRELKLKYFMAQQVSKNLGVEHLVVYTDKLLLKRVLTNLLSNAVRYTNGGGVLLAVRAAHGGDGLWLEVWDTGMGIKAEDLPRIFEPYVQIGNAERDRTQGMGLGLAITAHAVDLLGLKLTVQSRPGRGSCFRPHMPAAMCRHDSTIGSVQAETRGPVLAPKLAKRRVLLVEDDAMVLHAMHALLTGWQVDLRCASRGDIAVALDVCTPGWVPECVLCDFRLPGQLDGVALLDALLDYYPDAVGILQTGELAQNVRAKAEQAGYLLLTKPIEPSVLAQTLTAVLEHRNHLTKRQKAQHAYIDHRRPSADLPGPVSTAG